MKPCRSEQKEFIPSAQAKRLFRIERSVFQRILYNQELKRKKMAKRAGLKYIIRSTAKQCSALAAAWAHEALGIPRNEAMGLAGVKSTAFKKYLRRRRRNVSPKVNDVSLVRVQGRPRKYPIEVDSSFVI